MNIKTFTPDNFTLAELVDSEANYNICWDLDKTVAPTLRGLTERQAKKLEETHKCYYPPYNIFYVPSIVFSVNPLYRIPKLPFLYGISQHFPDVSIDAYDKTEEHWVEAFGTKLIKALNSMGFYPSKLTSPAGIYEECVLSKLNLPTIYDTPKEAAEYAWYCGGKLWIETYKRSGKTSWYYDLSSSFPNVAKDLIDIRYCKWSASRSYVDEAIYGYVKCEANIWDNTKISPIILTGDKSDCYLTKAELDFIRKWKLGGAVIENGWWAIPEQRIKPLEQPMEQLLAYKQSEDELVQRLAKRMSIGIYGKFGEEWNYKFAPLFNPVWFAEISTQVRLKVGEFIYRHQLQSNVIEVRVDGVEVDREVEGINDEWKLKNK